MSDDPDSPEVLANLLTNEEAAIIVAHLESLGIQAMTSGAGASTGWPEAPGYTQVVVRQADLKRAQQAIERMQK